MLILQGYLESFVRDLDNVEVSIIHNKFRVKLDSLIIDLDTDRDISTQFDVYIKHNKDKILKGEISNQFRSWLKDIKESENISEILINLTKVLPESFSNLINGVKIKNSEAGKKEVVFSVSPDNSNYIFSFTCEYSKVVLGGLDYIKEVLKKSLNEIRIEDLKSNKLLDWLENRKMLNKFLDWIENQ